MNKQVKININDKDYYCDMEVLKLIERLNDKVEILEYNRDKAIDHLHKRNEQNKSALTNKEQTIISKHELLKLEIINNEILENILRGNNDGK